MAHRFTSPVQPEEMSSDLPSLSDPEDADYHPGINDHPRIASLLDVMLVPQSRRITMSTTPSEKQKARESDPKDGRCLVSNESDPSCAIEVCHILPKATGAELVSPIDRFYYSYFSLLRLPANCSRVVLGPTILEFRYPLVQEPLFP